MKNITKFLALTFFVLTIVGCSSYREKFGGYKKNHHIQAEEGKHLKLSKKLKVEKKTTEYSIPKVKYSSDITTEDEIESLQNPPGF